MMPQSGKEIIAKHILYNISRSKGNQSMNFGLLIEYSMRNIFLEISFAKCLEGENPTSTKISSNVIFCKAHYYQ